MKFHTGKIKERNIFFFWEGPMALLTYCKKKKSCSEQTQLSLKKNRLAVTKVHFIYLLLFIFEKRITSEKDKLKPMDILKL